MNKTKCFMLSIGCGSVFLNVFLLYRVSTMDFCIQKEGRWYPDAVQETGVKVNYPIIAGTWVLTQESIGSVKEALRRSSGEADSPSALNSKDVTPFMFMMMLSGRYVILYNTPVLIGTSVRWSSLRYFGGVYGEPYKSVSNDNLSDGTVPASLGFGIDLPVNAITWELKINHDFARSAAEEGKVCLIVKTETIPDVWVPIYYQIMTTDGNIRLRRDVSFGKKGEKVMLEWMKVDHYASSISK